MSKEKQESEDCLECRLTGGLGFTAAGLYVIYSGHTMKGWDKKTMFGLGTAFCLVGLARLFNLGPFRRQRVTEALATKADL